MPIFSKYERQKYAQIAYGESLPIELYEGLHDIQSFGRVGNEYDPGIQNNISNISKGASSSACEIVNDISDTGEERVDENLTENGYKAVDCISAYLKEKISTGEKSLIESIMKLSITIHSLPVSRLPSVLFSVGQETAMNRKSKGRIKIKVQPNSQERWVCKIGSRQKPSSGRKLKLRLPAVRTNRPPNLAENVRNNERIANKARAIMKSKSLKRTREEGKATRQTDHITIKRPST